jgi:fermentation-respiration switch protein FrsA (DUF1100 family)
MIKWVRRAFVRAFADAAMIENYFLFRPTRYPDGDWSPQRLSFEDAHFSAPDGTRLHGWYVPHERPQATVLFAHGNGGNLSHRADLLRAWHDRAVAVLAFDYRGYGRSDGSPDEAGVLADARAARSWLAKRTNLREQDLILHGESLGGAVAVNLAAADGARGLVLENTFSSLLELTAFHVPWLPAKLLLRSRFDSAAEIGRYHGPLLQTHGDADTIVPIELGRRLFAAANEPKRFVVVPGADHNDPRGAAFYEALDGFLRELNRDAVA